MNKSISLRLLGWCTVSLLVAQSALAEAHQRPSKCSRYLRAKVKAAGVAFVATRFSHDAAVYVTDNELLDQSTYFSLPVFHFETYFGLGSSGPTRIVPLRDSKVHIIGLEFGQASEQQRAILSIRTSDNRQRESSGSVTEDIIASSVNYAVWDFAEINAEDSVVPCPKLRRDSGRPGKKGKFVGHIPTPAALKPIVMRKTVNVIVEVDPTRRQMIRSVEFDLNRN